MSMPTTMNIMVVFFVHSLLLRTPYAIKTASASTSVHKRIDRAFNNPLNPHKGIITEDPTVNNSGIKSMVIISVLFFFHILSPF